MANLTLNTSFKDGVLNTSTINNGVQRLTATGIVFDVDDQDRYLMFTDGNAVRYYRRIIEVHGDEEVSLEAPWGVSPFRAETSLRAGVTPLPSNVSSTTGRFIEPTPSPGDRFVLSYDLMELALNNRANVSPATGQGTFIVERDFIALNSTLETDGTVATTDRFLIDGRVSAANVPVVHARNLTFEFTTYSTVNSGDEESFLWLNLGTFIAGDINMGDPSVDTINGFPSNSCTLIDLADAFQESGRAGILGQFHQYGGSYSVPVGFNFLRMYDEGDAAVDRRQSLIMHDVDISGNFGCRVSGDRSVVLDGSARNFTVANPTSTATSDTTGNIGFFNPIRPGLMQGLAIQGTQQGIYNFPEFAGSPTIPATTIQNINGVNGARIIRQNNENSTAGDTLTLLDWSLDELMRESAQTTTELVHIDSPVTTVATLMHIDKTLNVSFLDEAAQSFAGGVRVAYRDGRTTGAVTTTVPAAVTSGLWSQRLRAWEFELSDTVENFQDTDAVQFTNYDIAFKARGRTFVTTAESLGGPIGPVNNNFALLPDINVTATAEQIDAYTTLSGSQELYNALDLFKFNNITAPSLTEVPATISGTQISLNRDIVLDHTATPIIGFASNVWTFKPNGQGSVWTGGITATADDTINVGNHPISGDLHVGEIFNIQTYNEVPTLDNRETVFSIGGTIEGDMTFNVLAGDTANVVFLTATGHTGTITVIGGGTLNVVGRQQGDFASTGNTFDEAGSGLSIVAGNVTAEPSPTVQPKRLRVLVSDLPDGSAFAVYPSGTTLTPTTSGVKDSTTNDVIFTDQMSDAMDGRVFLQDLGDGNVTVVFGYSGTNRRCTFKGFSPDIPDATAPVADTELAPSNFGIAFELASVDVGSRSVVVSPNLVGNIVEFTVDGSSITTRAFEPESSSLAGRVRATANYVRAMRARVNFLSLTIPTNGVGDLQYDVMRPAVNGADFRNGTYIVRAADDNGQRITQLVAGWYEVDDADTFPVGTRSNLDLVNLNTMNDSPPDSDPEIVSCLRQTVSVEELAAATINDIEVLTGNTLDDVRANMDLDLLTAILTRSEG